MLLQGYNVHPTPSFKWLWRVAERHSEHANQHLSEEGSSNRTIAASHSTVPLHASSILARVPCKASGHQNHLGCTAIEPEVALEEAVSQLASGPADFPQWSVSAQQGCSEILFTSSVALLAEN